MSRVLCDCVSSLPLVGFLEQDVVTQSSNEDSKEVTQTSEIGHGGSLADNRCILLKLNQMDQVISLSPFRSFYQSKVEDYEDFCYRVQETRDLMQMYKNWIPKNSLLIWLIHSMQPIINRGYMLLSIAHEICLAAL